MFNLFKKPEPQPTFDDVASEGHKKLRALINEAASRKLVEAGDEAAQGNPRVAADLLEEFRVLKWQAISIPLDMIERGVDLIENQEIK